MKRTTPTGRVVDDEEHVRQTALDQQRTLLAPTDPKAKFLYYVRGIPGHCVTAALTEMTPGINWSKCSKTLMAEQYALVMSDDPRRSVLGHTSLGKINLTDLANRARARMK